MDFPEFGHLSSIHHLLKFLTFYAANMTITGQGVMVGKYPGIQNILGSSDTTWIMNIYTNTHTYMYMLYIPIFILYVL